VTSVEISAAADADLVAIFDYGADQFGEDMAVAYVRGFAETFALLSRHPEIGGIHDTVRPPIHSLPHGRHRIYYDIIGERVIVQRILHQAMDVERWL
jgi:toxin ParE1/3/4